MGYPAEAVRLFQDRVEYRREIAGRGIDDLQHLGGRGLLLQGLAQSRSMSRAFSIAMTACSAKVRTSSICRSVNGSTRCTREADDADRRALSQQRHADHGRAICRASPLRLR